MKFSEKLKYLLDDRNYTQRKFAELLCVTQSTVSAWIRGQTPYSKGLKDLAVFFNTEENLLKNDDMTLNEFKSKLERNKRFHKIEEICKKYDIKVDSEEKSEMQEIPHRNMLAGALLAHISVLESKKLPSDEIILNIINTNIESIDSEIEVQNIFLDKLDEKIAFGVYSMLEPKQIERILSNSRHLLERIKLRAEIASFLSINRDLEGLKELLNKALVE